VWNNIYLSKGSIKDRKGEVEERKGGGESSFDNLTVRIIYQNKHDVNAHGSQQISPGTSLV
jgi:hypothetical protein